MELTLSAALAFLSQHPFLVAFLVFLAYQKYKASLPFPESGGRVTSIHSEEEWAKAKASATPCVVDFYATWCPPCRAIAPVYGEISTAHPRVDFYKVNVDEVRSVAQECGIRAMPTFKLFIKGVETGSVEGASRHSIEGMIAKAGLSGGAASGVEDEKSD